MSRSACPVCRHVHASNDARAIGLFGQSPPRYVAATANTPPRQSRAEAVADECRTRARRRRDQAPAVTIPQGEPVSRDVAAGSEPAPATEPFPVALMETAARAKAWTDFLAQVRYSLAVWQIDPAVRAEVGDVREWLGECRADLDKWAGGED